MSRQYEEVYMDVPAVRGIAKNLVLIGEVLLAANKTIEVLLSTVRTTAFIGTVGTAAYIRYVEQTKPYIEHAAMKCMELSQDINASVDAFERGDAQGAAKYY